MKSGYRIKELLFFVLGIIFYLNCQGQGNFVQGYIIKLQGDTVRGFIDYRGWGGNPKKISFKENLNDDRKQYFPIEIKGFMVHHEIYESAIVQTEVSPRNITELKADPELKIKIDTAFLQILVRGPRSLYYYRRNDGKEQFYINQDSGIELLIYKKYIKDPYNKDFIVENKRFIGQLSFYFKDCLSIMTKMESVEYRKKSLEKIFLSYANCKNGGSEIQNGNENTAIEIGTLTGLSVTAFKFNQKGNSKLVQAIYKPSVKFSFGLFINIPLRAKLKNWSSDNELIVSSFKVKGSYVEYTSPSSYSYISPELSCSYLKMNNILRYNFPIKGLVGFVDVGISNGFAFKEINRCTKLSVIYTTVEAEEIPAIEHASRFEQGLILGAGTKFKKCSLNIRYEIGTGLSRSVFITNRVYFFLGYKF